MVPLFAPISMLTTVPTLVVTRADSRFPDMKSALAEAKAKPGTVSIGHSGNGTTNHVAILRLQVNENVKFNIIPYRGSGPGLADLLAGQIDLYADQLTSSLPHIRAGKLRPLLASAPDRIAQLPDVPSLKDIGSQAVRRRHDGRRVGARRDAGAGARRAERRRGRGAQGRGGRRASWSTSAPRCGPTTPGRFRSAPEGSGGRR